MHKKFVPYICLLIVFAILAGFYFRAEKAEAAVYTENFDSYSVGNLNGQGSWSNITNNVWSVTTDVARSSPNSIEASGTGVIAKSMGTTTSGIYEGWIYFANFGSNTQGHGLVLLDNSNSVVARFGFDNDGSVDAVVGGVGSAPEADFTSVNADIGWNYVKAAWTVNGSNTEIRLTIENTTSNLYVASSTTPTKFGTNAINVTANRNFIDDLYIATNGDEIPISAITNINAPVDSLVYAFNPVPIDIDYNQLDTYNFMVFDVENTTLGQNVFVPPANLPEIQNEDLNYTGSFVAGLQGTYTFRARLYDSINNIYTDWSELVEFAVGSTSTVPIDDWGVSSSTFATSTAVDSGNLLSYVNVPQLLATKAPFAYFFQAYGIISNAISNPATASTFGSGSFEVVINNATTTVDMFSTSTVSYFLTPQVISPIREILVAIVYLVTLISIYTIVRHSHLL